MTSRVRFRPEAEADVLETRDWYEAQSPGLGSEFVEALDGALDSIARGPAAFPRVHRDVRRVVLARFPYAVYFRDHAGEIVVLAVHGRQDPRRWRARV